MEMKILLDTNAYSALMGGSPEARRIVSLAEHLYLPLPVIGELLFGFGLGVRAEENSERLQAFLEQSMVGLAGVDFQVCEVYAHIGKLLRLAGRPIPTNDHWIAAIAIRNNYTLLTRDRHFDHVTGLLVRHWEESL